MTTGVSLMLLGVVQSAVGAPACDFREENRMYERLLKDGEEGNFVYLMRFGSYIVLPNRFVINTDSLKERVLATSDLAYEDGLRTRAKCRAVGSVYSGKWNEFLPKDEYLSGPREILKAFKRDGLTIEVFTVPGDPRRIINLLIYDDSEFFILDDQNPDLWKYIVNSHFALKKEPSDSADDIVGDIVH